LSYLVKERGCDPNVIAGDYGVTPLHVAADANRLNAVKFLIEECGCNPSQRSHSGDTPLHFAAEKDSLEVAEYLLVHHRCNVLCQNEQKERPYDLAKPRVLHLIYAYVAEVKPDYNEEVYIPTMQHPPLYMQHEIKLDIHSSAELGRLEQIKYLISSKNVSIYSRNKYGATVLHVAAQYGQIRIIQFLIGEKEMRTDCIDIFERTPIFYAAIGGKRLIIKLLMTPDITLLHRGDVFHNTPLHYAAALGHSDFVLHFLFVFYGNYKVIEKKGIFKMTPVQMAKAGEKYETASLFTEQGYEHYWQEIMIKKINFNYF